MKEYGGRQMIKKEYIIAMWVIAMIAVPFNVGADVISVEAARTGQLIPNEDTPVFMQSQNITAYIGKNVHEITEYTLKNPSDSTLNLTLLLPFSGDQEDINDFPRPEDIVLWVRGIQTDFTWTTFTWDNPLDRTSYYWDDQVFNAILFDVQFEPYEAVVILAEYNRSYVRETKTDWIYEYLTMTGMLWNHSIEYAKFELYIDDEVKNYGVKGMNNYSVEETDNSTHITKVFHDWVPSRNIQVWIMNDHSPINPFFYEVTLPILIILGIIMLLVLIIIIKR
jgi:hypothetical protein